MENILSGYELKLSYRNQSVVHGLNLSINQGEMVGIVGPNGSGKSTVLRMLARLASPDDGAVYLEEEALAKMNTKAIARKLTMLPQMNDHMLDMSVRDLVRQGRHPHLKWYEECRGDHEKIVDWAIGVTDLKALQYRSLYTLSGGERQRAWIAMAIAQTPHTLLLDEPTTYLDIAHQLEIMELLKQLNRGQGMTIVTVLHDLNQAARYSDRIVAIKDGAIVCEGTPYEVFRPSFFKEVFSIEAKIFDDDGVPMYAPCAMKRDYTNKEADYAEVSNIG